MYGRRRFSSPGIKFLPCMVQKLLSRLRLKTKRPNKHLIFDFGCIMEMAGVFPPKQYECKPNYLEIEEYDY